MEESHRKRSSKEKVKTEEKEKVKDAKRLREIEDRIYELKAEIEGLEGYIKTAEARRFIWLIKRTGWYKGEIKDFTPKQFYKAFGHRPPPAVIYKGKVPYEYALDFVASELGYHGPKADERLKKDIEAVGKAYHKVNELKAELSSLKRTYKKLKEKVGKVLTIYKVPPNFYGADMMKKLYLDGRLKGTLVRFPPSYTIYKNGEVIAEVKNSKGAIKELRKLDEKT